MSIELDSIDDLISCGTADVFMKDNEASSGSAWIYPFSYGTAGRDILKRGAVRFSLATVSGFRCQFGGSTALIHRSTNDTIVINSWQHIAYTWTGTTAAIEAILYVNGATVAYSLTTDGVGLTTNDVAQFSIGSTGGFNGYITEAATWNAVLTTAEILILSRGGVRGLPMRVATADLVSYWPLEDVANGVSGDGVLFRDVWGTNPGTGSDGTNDTGCIGTTGEPLSYFVHVDKSRGMGRGIMHGGYF